MGRALNRMRDKLQRRSAANAPAVQSTNGVTAEAVNWGTADGMVIASFGGAMINYLAWTPAQAREVIAVIEKSIALLEAGK